MIPQYSGFKTKDEYLARIFGSDGAPKNPLAGADKMLENVGRGLVSLQPPPSYIDLGRVILDFDSIEKKTQDNAIKYWNEINDGRVMAAFGDYYWVTKQIMYDLVHGTEQEKQFAKTFLDKIRLDLKEIGIVCSDRLEHLDDLETDVISHYDSNKGLAKELNIKLGVSEHLQIRKALEDDSVFAFFQFLARTNDNREEILKTLESLSGKTEAEIIFFTYNVVQRGTYPQTGVWLYYSGGDGIFRIGCYCGKDIVSLSRGVRYEKKARRDLEK